MSLLLFLVDLVHVDVVQFGVHALVLFVVFAFLLLVLEFVQVGQQLLEVLVGLVSDQSGLGCTKWLTCSLTKNWPFLCSMFCRTQSRLWLMPAMPWFLSWQLT